MHLVVVEFRGVRCHRCNDPPLDTMEHGFDVVERRPREGLAEYTGIVSARPSRRGPRADIVTRSQEVASGRVLTIHSQILGASEFSFDSAPHVH